MNTQTRWVKVASGFASVPYGVVLPVDSERESWPGPNTVAVTYAGKPHLLSGYHVIPWPAPDTHTLKAADVTPQSIRALHQHIIGRGPEKLREFLTWISEGLRYGHDLTLTVGTDIGEGETGPDAVALGLTEPPYDPIAQQIGSEAQIRDWHASEDHKDCHPRQHDPRI